MIDAHEVDLMIDDIMAGESGGTYGLRLGPDARYVVGGYATAQVLPARIESEATVRDAIAAVARHGYGVGFWIDDKERIWIDAVAAYAALSTAMFEARANRERAIWDAVTHTEILLPAGP